MRACPSVWYAEKNFPLLLFLFFLPLYPSHTFEHRYNVRGTHLQFVQYPRIFHHPTACQVIIKTSLHRALPNTAGSSDRCLTQITSTDTLASIKFKARNLHPWLQVRPLKWIDKYGNEIVPSYFNLNDDDSIYVGYIRPNPLVRYG